MANHNDSTTNKCPHCGVSFNNDAPSTTGLSTDKEWQWTAKHTVCPTCHQAIIWLHNVKVLNNTVIERERLVYPISPTRMPYSSDIGHDFYDDYAESTAVMNISAKASAALSRRLLQHILREKAGIKHQDLSKEIDEFLSQPSVPDHIKQSLDAVRQVGNFAAHPIKSTSSGEVVAVEPDEAEWNLETIEELFEYFFLAPARVSRRRSQLNGKLSDAGKPQLK